MGKRGYFNISKHGAARAMELWLVLSNRHDVDSPLGNYIGNFVILT